MKSLLIFTVFLCFFNITNCQISSEDDEFLDDLERRAFLFFWEQANSTTGQVKDRAFSNGTDDNRPVSSIAATGFGLTALVIAHSRDYHPKKLIEERIKNTLDFIWTHLDGHKGFYYHFIDMHTGERVWNCELSSKDTAILINGILTVKAYFKDNNYFQNLTSSIYNRVDYEWMLNGQEVLSMGWKPESGFLKNDNWDRYCELLMLVLQAIGSPTHPILSKYWNSFKRDKYTYKNYTFITVEDGAPLFVHQFSHAWYDFQGKSDKYTDYYENSVIATKAHRLWMIRGYMAWCGPPIQGPIDGSVVPCAPAGSIPFLPKETISVLKNLKLKYPRSWDRYGFIDAFNPLVDWYNPDVIGIDVGITMIMAENYRSRLIWNIFMQNEHVVNSMKIVGFKNNTEFNNSNRNYLNFFILLLLIINFFKSI
ncbi:unnamed protein product [Brachionus calyciflorus]|uniref:Glycoamylase-like domain-containing protein n=1 Tax=Brachionus calyciflorus TaxID=104777 RepID=A0A814AZ86_9BILA|nr:unnamed protein product [Brachionus calyciflorus]